MALPERAPYIHTVPNPSVEREQKRREAEEQRKLQKSKELFQKKTAARNNEMKRSITKSIFFMAVLLGFVLYRGSVVFQLQNQYVSMQNEIRETLKNSEDLRSKIIKASSIGEVAEKSKNLELVAVDRAEYIEVDLFANHFSEQEIQTEEKSLSERIFSMIPFELAQ